MDNDPVTVDSSTAEDTLTSLHPNHVKLLRIQAGLTAIPFVIASLVLEGADLVPPGLIFGPVALIALLAIVRVPLRRHHARGYLMGDGRLRVVRGILLRSDSVVPFGRVQHIDVNQGPLERYYGLAALTVHTAGTHNASVHLPGLEQGLARAMREEIRAHIRRETL